MIWSLIGASAIAARHMIAAIRTQLYRWSAGRPTMPRNMPGRMVLRDTAPICRRRWPTKVWTLSISRPPTKSTTARRWPPLSGKPCAVRKATGDDGGSGAANGGGGYGGADLCHQSPHALVRHPSGHPGNHCGGARWFPYHLHRLWAAPTRCWRPSETVFAPPAIHAALPPCIQLRRGICTGSRALNIWRRTACLRG